VVGECDNLAGIDEFENVTPPGVAEALNVAADPVNLGTLYVGTARTGIYKSVNCGSTWTKVNTGRNSSVIDSGLNWTIIIDPNAPNILYTQSLYGSDLSLLKSTNGGQDWDSLMPPGSEIAMTVPSAFVQTAAMNPTNPRHLVVSFHDNCTGPHGPMCMAETKDGGATWRLFKGPTDGWSEAARPIVFDEQRWLFATYQDGAYYTPDAGATWERVLDGAGSQEYRDEDTVYLCTAWGVHVSTDGRAWQKMEGSPACDGLMGDGQRFFSGRRFGGGDNQPYSTSPQEGTPSWTILPSPEMMYGTLFFAYDEAHSLSYSANNASGLWRMVTK
jgi:photosystem II stability/assembly factor-like uncharacterized protein